jgi:hypothetical protein
MLGNRDKWLCLYCEDERYQEEMLEKQNIKDQYMREYLGEAWDERND